MEKCVFSLFTKSKDPWEALNLLAVLSVQQFIVELVSFVMMSTISNPDQIV